MCTVEVELTHKIEVEVPHDIIENGYECDIIEQSAHDLQEWLQRPHRSRKDVTPIDDEIIDWEFK